MDDKIRRENKKACPKFLLIMVLAGGIGAVVGYFCSSAEKYDLGQTLSLWFARAMDPILLWLLPAVTAFVLLYGWRTLGWVDRQRSEWDGEDEDLPERIDRQLDILSTVLGTSMPAAYLCFSAGCVYGDAGTDYLILGGELLIYLTVVMSLQRRTVDRVRSMNPEKQGSIFDMKFCSKWQNSLDEAEKKRQGEAALATFLVMQRVYGVTWGVLMFCHIAFRMGLMPVLVLSLLWICSSAIFGYKAIGPRTAEKSR